MRFDQVIEIQIGDNITIHNNKGIVAKKLGDLFYSATRPKDWILNGIGDMHVIV